MSLKVVEMSSLRPCLAWPTQDPRLPPSLEFMKHAPSNSRVPCVCPAFKSPLHLYVLNPLAQNAPFVLEPRVSIATYVAT